MAASMLNRRMKWLLTLKRNSSALFKWLIWAWNRMLQAATISPSSKSAPAPSLEQRARDSVRDFLQRLHEAKAPTSAMTYEAALERAGLAASFVEHPYWPIVARMLSGTIQSETEQLLVSDDHRDSNRASVAICRKYLNMPFFDIEQGKL